MRSHATGDNLPDRHKGFTIQIIRFPHYKYKRRIYTKKQETWPLRITSVYNKEFQHNLRHLQIQVSIEIWFVTIETTNIDDILNKQAEEAMYSIIMEYWYTKLTGRYTEIVQGRGQKGICRLNHVSGKMWASAREKSGAHRVLAGKPEGKRPL